MDSTHQKVDLMLLAARELLIRQLTDELGILRSRQARGIRRARASGSSWAEIAQAMHMSRQAVQKRAAHELLDDTAAGGSGTPE